MENREEIKGKLQKIKTLIKQLAHPARPTDDPVARPIWDAVQELENSLD